MFFWDHLTKPKTQRIDGEGKHHMAHQVHGLYSSESSLIYRWGPLQMAANEKAIQALRKTCHIHCNCTIYIGSKREHFCLINIEVLKHFLDPFILIICLNRSPDPLSASLSLLVSGRSGTPQWNSSIGNQSAQIERPTRAMDVSKF